MRQSTPKHWDDYWKKQDDLDDAYSNEDRLIDGLLQLMDPKGKKILEVGGGSGRDSIRLAQMGADVTVIDYVESSLGVGTTFLVDLPASPPRLPPHQDA